MPGCSTADGNALICEFTVNNLLDDPVVESYVVSAQIATSLADARDRVEFLAEHDSRTGLLNRDGFMRAAHSMMQDGRRTRHPRGRHRALPIGERVVRRTGRRRRARRRRRPDRPDPLGRPGDRPVRWRRVRVGAPGLEQQRRRDAARACAPRRRQADLDPGPGRQLRHPHRDGVRGAAQRCSTHCWSAPATT